MAISPSDTFGGFEAPGAARSQDLTISWTRESLVLASALIKLAEGRGASEEHLESQPLRLGKESGAPAGQGFTPLLTGSPIDEQSDGRPALPPVAKGRTPRSPQEDPRSFASYEPANSRLGSSPIRSCLSSSCLRSAAAATCSGFSRPLAELSLNLHETNKKSGQHQTKNRPILQRLSTLSNILKDQKADRSEKEVVRKKL
ncbi:hypothetical protein Cgig2_004472 [Carnegiea gigantea]|uniref:Uncharacterized protein n=1 Tax=Carnegiea gigantea TaxID=171969 RepID=A0A9Q1GJE4_9CARY|nr:hypothetical protein Cgig2_004472 [Carnegiea gigantea]